MITVLVNPIDVWSKVIDHDWLGQPIWGLIDEGKNVKARMFMEGTEDGSVLFSIKGNNSSYTFSAKWEPPDDEIKESLFSFFEELIGKTLNLCYRGEWNENHIQKWR